MNYKYIIALFAGDEVDSWTPPKGADWMLITDGKFWTDEFCQLKGISKQDRCLFKGYVWFPDEKRLTIKITDPVQISPDTQFIVYCNQQDQIIYIPRRFKLSDDIIQKIQSLIDDGLVKDGEQYKLDEL